MANGDKLELFRNYITGALPNVSMDDIASSCEEILLSEFPVIVKNGSDSNGITFKIGLCKIEYDDITNKCFSLSNLFAGFVDAGWMSGSTSFIVTDNTNIPTKKLKLNGTHGTKYIKNTCIAAIPPTNGDDAGVYLDGESIIFNNSSLFLQRSSTSQIGSFIYWNVKSCKNVSNHRIISSGGTEGSSSNPVKIITFGPSVKELPDNLFWTDGISSSTLSTSHYTNYILPPSVEILGSYCFPGSYMTEFSIPASVKKINGLLMQRDIGTSGSFSLIFNTAANASIELPTKLFNFKSARSINIYTDNTTIKNYNWSNSNITPTFYHLDGTAWS